MLNRIRDTISQSCCSHCGRLSPNREAKHWPTITYPNSKLKERICPRCHSQWTSLCLTDQK